MHASRAREFAPTMRISSSDSLLLAPKRREGESESIAASVPVQRDCHSRGAERREREGRRGKEGRGTRGEEGKERLRVICFCSRDARLF